MGNRAGYASTHITSATTTAVKATGGRLIRVVVNNVVASTITINDAVGAKAVIGASAPVGSLEYDIVMSGKIEVVTAGASDLTVVYE